MFSHRRILKYQPIKHSVLESHGQHRLQRRYADKLNIMGPFGSRRRRQPAASSIPNDLFRICYWGLRESSEKKRLSLLTSKIESIWKSEKCLSVAGLWKHLSLIYIQSKSKIAAAAFLLISAYSHDISTFKRSFKVFCTAFFSFYTICR